MTKVKKLSEEYVRSILDYDPDTGKFVWKFRPNLRKSWNNRLAGKETGCVGWAGKNKGEYILLRIDDVLYKAHRIAWLYVYGEWPDTIDHIDLDGKNNKITNLRNSTRSQNQCNHKIQSNNTSGWKGVCYYKQQKKWGSKIKLKRKTYHLGFYNCPTVAYLAYCKAAKKYHGEYARFE